MSETILTVPQLGEGLREARLVKRLKTPGEAVAVDEPLYEMETEKATVEVESSVAGTVVGWEVAEGDVVAVHAPIVRIAAEQPAPALRIAPRVRAFARERGVADAVLAAIPRAGGALTEGDIARWLEASIPAPVDHEDHPLSPRQRAFNRRAFGDPAVPVSATLRRPLDWARVQAARERWHLSEFQVVALAAGWATREHPKLRSRLLTRETVRQYPHLDLGFAVRLPDDELATAVVRAADTLAPEAFGVAFAKAMRQVLRGQEDQADERTTLLLTYLGAYGIVDADPVLTAPAAAVLFLGAPQATPSGESALLTLTFDHRLMNGVGAALYLGAVCDAVERLG